MEYTELHVYSPNADQAFSLPRTVAWMNGEWNASGLPVTIANH